MVSKGGRCLVLNVAYSLMSPDVSTSKIGSGSYSSSSLDIGPEFTGNVSGVSKFKSKGRSELFLSVSEMTKDFKGSRF